jgi:erythromycin esterase
MRLRPFLPFLWLALALGSCGFTQAQTLADHVAYLHEQAIVVRNVEPTNEAYADLAPLKQRLQAVTVVGLGEPIHYDGSAFKAKTRLVKFLHQELGFRVLAFESGFVDCYKAWQAIQTGTPALVAARQALYPFWISTETEELFRYIEQQKHTDKPLILAGIDCKFTGAYSQQQLLPDLRTYLLTIHSPAVQDTAHWRAFRAALQRVIARSDYFTKPSPADTLVLNPALRRLLVELQVPASGSAVRSPEQVFWQQFCRNSLVEIGRKFASRQVSHGQNTNEQGRDQQMGNNALFLQQQLYPGEKMIVWAASSHLTYQGANIDLAFYHQQRRVGDYLKQVYGERYYNVGFTGYRGKFGKLLFFHVLNVKKHQPTSIEYALGQTKQPFLFIDFRQPNLPQWLRDPQLAMPFGYRELRMKLPLVMDGLFYTQDVFPNHWLRTLATSEQKQ